MMPSSYFYWNFGTILLMYKIVAAILFMYMIVDAILFMHEIVDTLLFSLKCYSLEILVAYNDCSLLQSLYYCCHSIYLIISIEVSDDNWWSDACMFLICGVCCLEHMIPAVACMEWRIKWSSWLICKCSVKCFPKKVLTQTNMFVCIYVVEFCALNWGITVTSYWSSDPLRL